MDVDYTKPTDAQRLRDLLARIGLSQRGAARELEVAERTMRYWCSGEQPVPRMAMLALEHLASMQLDSRAVEMMKGGALRTHANGEDTTAESIERAERRVAELDRLQPEIVRKIPR